MYNKIKRKTSSLNGIKLKRSLTVSQTKNLPQFDQTSTANLPYNSKYTISIKNNTSSL